MARLILRSTDDTNTASTAVNDASRFGMPCAATLRSKTEPRTALYLPIGAIMTVNRSRHTLDVLMADYLASRDDERTFTSVAATFFGLALTALSIMGFNLLSDCQLTGQLPPACHNTPVYALAAAPLIPLALIAYMQITGSQATIRSFYLRALERDIRNSIALDERQLASYSPLIAASGIEGYSPLMVASSTELKVASSSLSRGANGTRVLTTLLFVSILIVFGGVTAISIAIVTLPWGLAMTGLYGGGALAIVREAHRSTVGGRRVFQQTVRAAASRALESLAPLAQAIGAASESPRRLTSYLILPRPEDLIKAPFFPVLYLLSGIFHPAMAFSLGGLLRASILWISLELFIYQARYQINDILGIDDDRSHPYNTTRGRLPTGSDDPEVTADAIRASVLVVFVRLYCVVIFCTIFVLDIAGQLAAYMVVVFGIAFLYEVLRRARPTTPLATSLVSWSIFVTVGLGYALRGIAGFVAAVPVGSYPEPSIWIPVAAFLMFFGSLFVVCTWILDASSYCTKYVKARLKVDETDEQRIPWVRGLSHKPHLAWLLADLRIALNESPEPETTNADTSLGSYSRTMLTQSHILSAMNVFTMAAGVTSVIAGQALVGAQIDYHHWPLLLIAALGSTLICIGGKAWRRWLWVLPVAGVVVIASWLTDLPTAVGAIAANFPTWPLAVPWLMAGLIVVLPWLVFSATAITFRGLSYRELKYGWQGVLSVLHIRSSMVLRSAIGEGAANALRLKNRDNLVAILRIAAQETFLTR